MAHMVLITLHVLIYNSHHNLMKDILLTISLHRGVNEGTEKSGNLHMVSQVGSEGNRVRACVGLLAKFKFSITSGLFLTIAYSYTFGKHYNGIGFLKYFSKYLNI